MIRLLHFSDPHVQLPRWRERTLRELGPLRSLATVELWKGRGRDYDDAHDKLAALATHGLAADHVVCTGDLTQLGHPEEFALARGALAPLDGRLTCIAGNHDRYPWDGAPNRFYEESFPGQAMHASVRVTLAGQGLAFFALDSAGAVSWPVLSGGSVSDKALAQLATELRGHGDRCKLVLVHHAPLRRGGRRDLPWHELHNARKLLRVAAEGGAAAVLCGHIHDRFDHPAGPGRARVICAGSSTERGHEGYWEIAIEGGRIVSADARAI